MSVLFIGKRFYTNRDALKDRYGRIWQMPWHWAQSGIPTRLWLVDYHTRRSVREMSGALDILSTPVQNLSVFRQWVKELRPSDHKVDVVVASGDCYIGLMGRQIARRLRSRFVFDVYDKYDEFAGYKRLPGFDPFRFLLRHADARLFASRALMERIGVGATHDLFVPNGVDLSHFHPRDMYTSRACFDIPADSVCVGYFGSMTPDRGVEDLVAAVAVMRQSGLNVDLVLAGQRYGQASWNEPWIRYLGNLPYDQVPTAMACCDVLTLPYRHSDYLDMASSCKIAEYIAMQRPLAMTDTPNFSMNFPEQAASLGSYMARPGAPYDLARAIALQLENRRSVSMPEGFSWESIAGRLVGQLELHASAAAHCRQTNV